MDIYAILMTVAATVALVLLAPLVLAKTTTRLDQSTQEVISGIVGTIGGWTLFFISVANYATIYLPVTILSAVTGFTFVFIGVNYIVGLPWRTNRRERRHDASNETPK